MKANDKDGFCQTEVFFFGVSRFGVGGVLGEQLHSLYGWFIKVIAVKQDVSRSLEERPIT